VVVFDRYGTVLHKFGCSRHLEFPNGVVANDQDEIFISDNRSHCVKVCSLLSCVSGLKHWKGFCLNKLECTNFVQIEQSDSFKSD